MVTPLFFRDFNKPADVILNDDYSLKRTLRMKFVTTNGITLTTDSELVGKDGKYEQKAKLSGKYKHIPTGFAVDKLQLKESGGVTGEFSLSGVAPGLTFTFKGEEKPTGELGVEYVGTKYAVKSEIDLVQLSKLKANAVLVHEGAKVGADVEVALPDAKSELALNKWTVGTGYGTPKAFASALATNGKNGLDYSLFGVYKLSPPIAVAVRATIPASGIYGLTFGGIYQCNPKTKIKSKVTLNGLASACVIQDVLPKVQLIATAEGSIKNLQDYKVGFGAFLG